MNFWASYEKEHPTIKLPPFLMLSKLRRFTRLTITVDWAVNQIVSCQPEKLEDIPEHAKMIESKLIAKGVGTQTGVPCPKFLQDVLEAMKAQHKVEGVASPSAAESAALVSV